MNETYCTNNAEKKKEKYFSKVANRIYIGNINAAWTEVDRCLAGKEPRFNCILDASGEEHMTVVRSQAYAVCGIAYTSMFDMTTRSRFDDCCFRTTREIAAIRVSRLEFRPSLVVSAGTHVCFSYIVPHSTRAAFRLAMVRSVRYIESMSRDSSRRVLVHCRAGINRSAACIVSYFTFGKPALGLDESINLVRKANWRRGCLRLLENSWFVDELRRMTLELPKGCISPSSSTYDRTIETRLMELVKSELDEIKSFVYSASIIMTSGKRVCCI